MEERLEPPQPCCDRNLSQRHLLAPQVALAPVCTKSMGEFLYVAAMRM